jgi:hypothetical protein
MFIATIVVAVLFAVLLAASAVGKLRRDASQVAVLERVGATRMAPVLAGLELAAAAGLLVGLAWWPIGVAAGVGAALYFVGAIVAHLRVGDRAVLMPVVLLLVSAAVVVLRILSAG